MSSKADQDKKKRKDAKKKDAKKNTVHFQTPAKETAQTEDVPPSGLRRGRSGNTPAKQPPLSLKLLATPKPRKKVVKDAPPPLSVQKGTPKDDNMEVDGELANANEADDSVSSLTSPTDGHESPRSVSPENRADEDYVAEDGFENLVIEGQIPEPSDAVSDGDDEEDAESVEDVPKAKPVNTPPPPLSSNTSKTTHKPDAATTGNIESAPVPPIGNDNPKSKAAPVKSIAARIPAGEGVPKSSAKITVASNAKSAGGASSSKSGIAAAKPTAATMPSTSTKPSTSTTSANATVTKQTHVSTSAGPSRAKATPGTATSLPFGYPANKVKELAPQTYDDDIGDDDDDGNKKERKKEVKGKKRKEKHDPDNEEDGRKKKKTKKTKKPPTPIPTSESESEDEESEDEAKKKKEKEKAKKKKQKQKEKEKKKKKDAGSKSDSDSDASSSEDSEDEAARKKKEKEKRKKQKQKQTAKAKQPETSDPDKSDDNAAPPEKKSKSTSKSTSKSQDKDEKKPGCLTYYRSLGTDVGLFADIIKRTFFRGLCRGNWYPSRVERVVLATNAHAEALVIWNQYLTSIARPPVTQAPIDLDDHLLAMCHNLPTEFRGAVKTAATKEVVVSYALFPPTPEKNKEDKDDEDDENEPNKEPDPEYVKGRVAALDTPGYRFARSRTGAAIGSHDAVFTVAAKYFYRPDIITDTVELEAVSPLPVGCIALVIVAIQCVLREWATGKRPKAIPFKEPVFRPGFLSTLQELEKLRLADPNAWEAMMNRHEANMRQAAPATSQWMNVAGEFADDQQGDEMET